MYDLKLDRTVCAGKFCFIAYLFEYGFLLIWELANWFSVCKIRVCLQTAYEILKVQVLQFIPQRILFLTIPLSMVFFYNFRAISSMLFTLLWPIIPWLLQLIVFCWFVAVGVYPFVLTERRDSLQL